MLESAVTALSLRQMQRLKRRPDDQNKGERKAQSQRQ